MESLGHDEVIKLLLQLSIILLAGRLMAELARRFNQPAVVGEIFAGILLGPTVFGMLAPDTFNAFFQAGGASFLVFEGVIQVSVILLLFIAGLEVELQLVWAQGKQALSTSIMGLIFPLAIGFVFPFYFSEFFDQGAEAETFTFALFVGTAMSISALPVIARILMDLGIFRSKVGMLVISAAMINDLLGWLIFSVIISMMGTSGSHMSLEATILLTLAFTVFMLTIGKKLINRVLPVINRRFAWPGGVLSLSLSACFLASAFTEYIGIHAIFGAFILGVALGDSAHMPERAKEIVHQFINNIFAPIFFVSIGLKVNFIQNFNLWLVLAVLIIAFVGKVVGSGLGARWGGLEKRESVAVGFGMNARGAMEIILGLVALENGIIGEQFFVALVIMAIITSVMSGPLMKIFLNPAKA
ncbi:cation:proton antiporter [Nafulsella turpanensis]|uniref:cation:proton antiporter n=1 Tax=Nafulsella turpanensis TaxID=1265690 RepID=UPI0003485D9C|nr:cation:proton antiporter [Nafulsella turpanensis]